MDGFLGGLFEGLGEFLGICRGVSILARIQINFFSKESLLQFFYNVGVKNNWLKIQSISRKNFGVRGSSLMKLNFAT